MQITFWGAARTVTGSQHLIEMDGQRLLLDCGLFQGRRAEAYRINQHLPFDPAEVDAMVLSHAHIDHCGNVPNLVKTGFKGVITCTHATRDLCATMLRDSGKIQEDDVRFLNKRRQKNAPIEPIYTLADAEASLKQFQSVSYDRPTAVGTAAQVTFGDAGHMLGSAWELLQLKGQREVRLCFSGDLGRVGMPILRDPAPMPESDYLILESTYGDRLHDPIENALPELKRAVTDAVRRGGKIVIPAFAVGRTQEIVYFFNQLMVAGELPNIPIYIDSPLAVNVTEAFRTHPECYDQETKDLLQKDQDGDVFGFKRITYVRSVEESKAINDRPGPLIIVSASGMCENGRILHHLRNTVEDPKNMILFVSFQAPHTLGARILEESKILTILGDDFKLRAEVRRIESFSGHADRNDLLAWVKPQAKNLRGVFLVHGEPDSALSLAAAIRELGVQDVRVPAKGDVVELH